MFDSVVLLLNFSLITLLRTTSMQVSILRVWIIYLHILFEVSAVALKFKDAVVVTDVL